MRLGAGRGISIAAVALAAAALLLVLTQSGSQGGHQLRAAFESGLQLVPGQEVRIAGRDVGEIESVELESGEAVVELSVDDAAWPLPRGTTAEVRWGAASAYASRYVELKPGPKGGPALKDGGILAVESTTSAVEFDQLNRIFKPSTRREFKGLLSNASDTLHGREDHLARGLRLGGGGLQSLTDLFDDLGADRAALRTLVTAGARTTAAIRSRDAQFRSLIDDAGATFDEFAARAEAQQAALDRYPAALGEGTHTLARFDHSLVGMHELVDDVRPGAAALRRMAGPARRATDALLDVSPLATSTLDAGTSALPAIRKLLSVGAPFMPRLARTLREATPMIGCLRPYAPEIAGFLSAWVGFQSSYDDKGRYTRATFQTSPIPNGTDMTTAEAMEANPGKFTYAMPRPPGLNAGQPWFMPECGITPDALDPAKDPEAGK